ncbi:restriction endonuclease subunit S [Ruminococcus sp. AM26-12LB]|jgi:type I restriction enzyme S subunit|uniref:restriction endonuclease subunit S n=1 Tax=Ruminococcus sp. AM26-12LB TaxID=2293190 RepID=UPI001A9AF856|nr:restriction endonuclease subunit S [Ruminococcus sp. AM26-12LB]
MAKPTIRFRGFDDEWEQRKLGEVLKERSERANGSEELLSVTIGNGVIKQADSDKRNTASDDKSNYKIVRKGDLPYNSMRMWQGAVGNSEYDGIVSPAYTVLVPTEEANSKFFMELFKKESTLQIFQRWSQGLTSDTWNLKYPALSTIQFYIPSVFEQTKIADYFIQLDHLITLHQRKCDETKKLKKYMLQKMFPQNGSKVPEIRFKGFTDEWEQRKLDDVVEFLDTMRKPLEGAKRISGPYPYYGASGIVDYVDGYLFDEELILLSEDGANIIDRNYPVCFLASGKYWVNNHAHVLRTKQGNENNFICNSLERKDYTQYNTGMAMPKLNKETCKKIPILCPGFEEQKKIGDYFRSLDNLITLHQHKCEEIKKLKKFMLQNMFI